MSKKVSRTCALVRPRARSSPRHPPPADLDLVPRLEALAPERPQHAHPAQPLLQIGHRLLVLYVIAREQALDTRPVHHKGPLAAALDLEARARGRPEHHVLGQLLGLERRLDRS